MHKRRKAAVNRFSRVNVADILRYRGRGISQGRRAARSLRWLRGTTLSRAFPHGVSRGSHLAVTGAVIRRRVGQDAAA